jgi:hypothetical protein
MASTQLTKSVQKNAGNDNITKMTYSVWIKRSALGEADIFAAHQLSTYYTDFYFDSNDRLNLYSYINASEAAWVQTNRKFRDTNAWYHLVFAIDTTQGTAANRVKFYVNGTQETSMNSTVYPSQNSSFGQFSDTGATLYIGNNPNRTAFDGVMSHIHYTPYTTYDASPFGSTDATTGEWKINTNPSVTYGTAGFFILKDGNSVTDQSGQSNNFTVGSGTLTKTEDCPSNVYATLNPLDNYYANSTFSNGNTSQTSNASAYGWVPSTLGMTTGKFYAECKQTGFSGGSNYNLIGITGSQNDAPTHYLGQVAYTAGYYAQGNVYNQSGSATSTYASYTTNDIIGVALDLDNNKLYFSKNGVWQNSGDPTSGATGTGALNITAPSAMTGTNATGVYRFASGDYGNSVVVNNSWNFGNGYFGTTAVASAGTNASGNGIFEYDVPTGYTALSTKGLNL